MTNVIDLGEALKRAEQARFDSIVEEMEEDENVAQSVADSVVFDLVDLMYEMGYDVSTRPVAIRDLMLLRESIVGVFRRTRDAASPSHAISESMFVYDSDVDAMLQFLSAMSEYEDEEP